MQTGFDEIATAYFDSNRKKHKPKHKMVEPQHKINSDFGIFQEKKKQQRKFAFV